MNSVPINGYEGLYTIDENGNVFSLKRNIFRKVRKPNKYFDYKRITLNKCGIAKTFSIHRLVAIAFIDNPKNKPCVNHKDGNKLNNYDNNLEWVTYSENTKHAFENGLIGYTNTNKNGKISGEDNGNCKLSNEVVKTIRKEYTGKYGEQTKLAKKYKVNRLTIYRLVNNKCRRRI